MKLSSDTVNILKNFSVINEGIFIKKGSVIETISKQKNILARAELKDSFDDEFGIYDINNFLGVISLNGEPDLEFQEKDIIIKGFSGKSKTLYRKTPKNMIIVPPDKKINMADAEISFGLSSEEIKWVIKNASALSSPNIAFKSDGSIIEVNCFDTKNDGANINSTQIESAGNGKKYNMIFSTENLKLIEGAYTVTISSKGISHFKHTTNPIEYWIMSEVGSKYES